MNPLLLSFLAGLGTALGGLVALSLRPSKDVLGFSLSFASGIMMLISFLGLLGSAIEILGYVVASLAFLMGLLSMFALDCLLPHVEFVYKAKDIERRKLLKTGLLVATGIALHNLPEGFAVATGYLFLPIVGLVIACAIAAHNIPEGLATALPLRAAGFKRLGAFLVALLAGLTEPLGALIGVSLLYVFPQLLGFALAFAGGAMVFIASDELIPTAHRYGKEHVVTFGLITGFLGGLFLQWFML
jgi:ZIP family zinc transporter